MVQMPAMSTPQFSWVLLRLPRTQSVSPVYRPELAATLAANASARHS
jgi:hypothetical protein